MENKLASVVNQWAATEFAFADFKTHGLVILKVIPGRTRGQGSWCTESTVKELASGKTCIGGQAAHAGAGAGLCLWARYLHCSIYTTVQLDSLEPMQRPGGQNG